MHYNKLIILGFILAVIFLGCFYSYRLTTTPAGLTSDEAAFGYNAVLLSKTGRDETGRKWPIFVLSLGGKDWRQPITQYYVTALFKLFGPSIYLLRLSSVVIALISIALLFWLIYWQKGLLMALGSGIILALTPLLLIQTHLGLDNIAPVPLTILWLMGLTIFNKNKQSRWLVLSAISLGLSFYSYKGMRAVVPVWSVLSIGYLWLINKNSWQKFLKNGAVFSLTISPFFLIIPWLNVHYAGAVFNGYGLGAKDIYSLIYPYLSTFDLGFLFIKGDDLLFHSTQKHGMMLLATLPLFLIGVYQTIKKKDSTMLLVLAAFLSAPLLYGYVDSIHRASRLMCLLPSYSILCAGGIEWMIRSKSGWYRWGLVAIGVAILANYADFSHYYWHDYTRLSQNLFEDASYEKAYEQLAIASKKEESTPVIASDMVSRQSDAGKFIRAMHLDESKISIKDSNDKAIGLNSVLLTYRENIEGMTEITAQMPRGYFLQRK